MRLSIFLEKWNSRYNGGDIKLSKVKTKKQSSREQFMDSAKNGKILVNQCKNCDNLILETIYYCDKCFTSSFKQVLLMVMVKLLHIQYSL